MSIINILIGLIVMNAVMHIFQTMHLDEANAKTSQVYGIFTIGLLNVLLAVLLQPIIMLWVFIGLKLKGIALVTYIVLNSLFYISFSIFKYSRKSRILSNSILLLDLTIALLFTYLLLLL